MKNMQTSIQQRKTATRTFDSNPRASKQASVDTLLQKMAIQRQAAPEEDELLQGKFESVQREVLDMKDEEELLQGKFSDTAQLAQEENPKNSFSTNEKSNMTGIPSDMKEHFESMSGLSFDDVRVHYNSDKPEKLQAHAYTQGNQVHIGPGQEKHLGHELGHVVQQKEGRVRPTRTVNGVSLNDNPALEHEADIIKNNMINLQAKTHKRSEKIIQQVVQRVDRFIGEPHIYPHLHISDDFVTLSINAHNHIELERGETVHINRIQNNILDIQNGILVFLNRNIRKQVLNFLKGMRKSYYQRHPREG